MNLVHLPDGRWNLESILLQAARMPAAPTDQKGSGVTPRFPYIEATGARVNVKQGVEKLPLSLTDATFSLWLPEPDQWRLRLKGKPTRTDSVPRDSGTLELEGTLGKADKLEAVPVDLEGEWSAAPLGAVSDVLLGRDAGLRGEMTLTASVHGRVGDNAVDSRLVLKNLRRREFVPVQTLAVDLRCTAEAANLFHALRGVRCAWPAGAVESGLQLSGELPNVFEPGSATGRVTLKDVPLSGLLDGLRVASARVSPGLTATGTLAADVRCCENGLPSGSVATSGAQLAFDAAALGQAAPFLEHDMAGAFAASGELALAPVELQLGGTTPATIEIAGSKSGYRMQLTGMVVRSRVEALASALPQFGDGLAEVLPRDGGDQPTRVDLQSARLWGGAQTWTAVAVPAAPAKKRRRHG